MKIIEGSVTAPEGFLASGNCAEIRKANKKDLAIIYSKVPCAAAGVFTTNLVRAACVDFNQKTLKNGKAQVIVVNSGNANACTGISGEKANAEIAAHAAKILNLSLEDVLIASTGVIGVELPVAKVIAGLDQLVYNLSPEGASDVAEAMMTTDLYDKQMAVEIEIGGKTVRLGAIAKGSGMIHPNMATMLAFITTDAAITPECLKKALQDSTLTSYNMISVDRDTSTNDMALILANGTAGNSPITDMESPEYKTFYAALHAINIVMAKKIARDGEGATHLIEMQVEGAPSDRAAQTIARSIISSNLVKAAVFGQDANWGRILCAAGYAGADFDFNQVDVYLGEVKVAENGMGLVFDEAAAKKVLEQENVTIRMDMKQGDGLATAWGCDLTFDYVKINGSYRT